jgi:small subunit ribosomal protein S16
MLRIRLSRHGRRNRPFFRIVLTEHTKPVKSWYKEVLGWYDPINHKQDIDIERMKEWISKWAKPSERAAKLAYKISNDELFKKYFKIRNRQRPKKKEE